MERLPEKIDSKFRFVLLAALRAEQMMQGSKPRVEDARSKPSKLGMREVMKDLVEWEYGPRPEAEDDESEAAEAAEA